MKNYKPDQAYQSAQKNVLISHFPPFALKIGGRGKIIWILKVTETTFEFGSDWIIGTVKGIMVVKTVPLVHNLLVAPNYFG